MWQAVRLTIIQYLKNDKFSSNMVVLFMQKREHPVFRHLYSRNSLDFLPPFLKFYEIFKKAKSAHEALCSVCAYSLLADILLGLGNGTYVVKRGLGL